MPVMCFVFFSHAAKYILHRLGFSSGITSILGKLLLFVLLLVPTL